MNPHKVTKIGSILSTAFAFACSETQSAHDLHSSQATPSGSSIVSVSTPTKTYVSAEPAELKASFGGTPLFNLSISAARNGESWSIVAELPTDQVSSASGAVQITASAIGVGAANLTRTLPNGTTQQASGGTFSFTAAKGKITATVTAEPAELSATVQGSLAASCWVPRMGDAAAQGTTSGDSSDPLVQDASLSSSDCQMIQGWAK